MSSKSKGGFFSPTGIVMILIVLGVCFLIGLFCFPYFFATMTNERPVEIQNVYNYPHNSINGEGFLILTNEGLFFSSYEDTIRIKIGCKVNVTIKKHWVKWPGVYDVMIVSPAGLPGGVCP